MPDALLTALRTAAGPDLEPSPAARRTGLDALRREVHREVPTPRAGRVRRARILAPAAALAGAGLVAVALVPGPGPAADEVLARAVAVLGPAGTDILFAESEAHRTSADGETSSYGTRRIWVHQPKGEKVAAMRWLNVTGGSGVPAGSEDVSDADGERRYDPVRNRSTHDASMAVPTDIFRTRELLARARAGHLDVRLSEVELAGRDAYRLRWPDRHRSGNVTVTLTLWIDRDTYVPLRFEDRSRGTDVAGRRFDETFTETVTRFERLPETPENLELLEMGRHPGATEVPSGG